MIHLRRYTADDKSLWNSFVQESKNGTFLFLRNFMEYHQDRFTDHSGNCFTYAAMAKFLLTRAGIENIDIVKVVPEGSTDIPTHFWNLVNIGDGWYHYDVTPRKDGSTFFYITDAKLHEYSDKHNYTHRYDESLYPEIQ